MSDHRAAQYDRAHARWERAVKAADEPRAREALADMKRLVTYRWEDRLAHARAVEQYTTAERRQMQLFNAPPAELAGRDPREVLWRE